MANFRETALQNGIHATIVPFSRLTDLRTDIDNFAATQELNGFQKFIVEHYEYAPQEPKFEPQAVIVTATPHPSFGDAVFELGGKNYTVYYTAGAGGNKPVDYATKVVTDAGYSLERTGFWFANKRFAVQAGLCEYGRDNIAYLPGYGSYIALDAFYTDMPADEDSWRSVVTSDACTDCHICEAVCPTSAIVHGRFLIDCTRCICNLNESPEPFPDFMPKDAHHAIVGCLRCQYVCPMNEQANANTYPTVHFTEAETARLMQGAPYEDLEASLSERYMFAEMNFAGDLPRNLQACFDIIDGGGTLALI